MLHKIATVSLVTVAIAGGTLATSAPAEARYGHHHHGGGGAFLGGAALGLLGGALLSGGYGYGYGAPYYYDSYPAYYYPRRCHWERRLIDDYYGGYYRRVRVCY